MTSWMAASVVWKRLTREKSRVSRSSRPMKITFTQSTRAVPRLEVSSDDNATEGKGGPMGVLKSARRIEKPRLTKAKSKTSNLMNAHGQPRSEHAREGQLDGQLAQKQIEGKGGVEYLCQWYRQ
jgi:hypothetical protein